MKHLRYVPIIILVALLAASCGKDEKNTDNTCTTTADCDDGQVCELVAGGEAMCFAPVQIEGRVYDIQTGDGIEGARVVALDANGGPVGPVAVTSADGTYTITVPVTRDADGNPQDTAVTLRVDASGYTRFPKAPRTALPIELGNATMAGDSDPWVVQNAATDVGLVALEGDTSTLGSISGNLVFPDSGLDGGVGAGTGVLVVAEVGGEAVATAISDPDGNFVLFNVPAGGVTVHAYAAGLNFDSAMVTVNAGEDTGDVTLTATTEGLSTVSGSLEFADASCSDGSTTVILVPESTLEELIPDNPNFLRGEAPPGLRDGDAGGTFSIDNVPPGDYAVLAAYENDCLVRDPDIGIGNTAVLFITVPGDGSPVDAGSFKVTGALAVNGPGADGIEKICEADPEFSWARDPSVDGYELRVFDALGNLVCTNLDVPAATGTDTISAHCTDYTTPGFDFTSDEGMIYQFRALSFALPPMGTERTYRSATEDLKGVFETDCVPDTTMDGGVPDAGMGSDAGTTDGG